MMISRPGSSVMVLLTGANVCVEAIFGGRWRVGGLERE